MRHLHTELGVLAAGTAVVVDLAGAACNVLLVDDAGYRGYTSGSRFRYSGGHYTRSPAVLRTPAGGRWHVVVDLGGRPGTVHAAVRVGT